MKKANIFQVKHFAVHDGPGIRTTVFFKACPLKCVWCHNPEGLSSKRELSFTEHKCTNCQGCVEACPQKAHYTDENGVHRFNRELCIACGKCVDACFNSCLTLYGSEKTSDELLQELLEDKDFYDSSNGGVTLSGGECLMQADFCRELLSKLKKLGIHTAVDTCGFVSKEALDKVIPYTDLFLYDLKAADEEVHIKCTGQSNKLILENLSYLSSLNKPIEIRIPYVPDCNCDQMEKLGDIITPLASVTGVRVLAYHNYAQTKYKSLGIPSTLPNNLPTKAELDKATEILRSKGIKVLE